MAAKVEVAGAAVKMAIGGGLGWLLWNHFKGQDQEEEGA